MKIGTKSVLFGAHCFFLHPWFVAAAWWKVMWCGWPEGIADRDKCEIVESCTDEEHWRDMRQARAFRLLESRRESECLEMMHL